MKAGINCCTTKYKETNNRVTEILPFLTTPFETLPLWYMTERDSLKYWWILLDRYRNDRNWTLEEYRVLDPQLHENDITTVIQRVNS